MTSEQNKALVRRFNVEVHNEHDLSAIDRFFSPTFVDHSAADYGDTGTREGTKMFFQATFASVPDFGVDIREQAADGDKVFTFKTVHGTHRGTWMGIPPTGKQFSVNVIDILTVVDGQFTEHWIVMDMLGLLQQLGVIPAMA